MFLLPIGGITVALILVGFFGAAIFTSGLIIPIVAGFLLYVTVAFILGCLGIVSPSLPYIFSEAVVAFFTFSGLSLKWWRGWDSEAPEKKRKNAPFYITIISFYFGLSLFIAEIVVGMFNVFTNNYDAPREIISIEFFEVYACLWFAYFLYAAVLFIKAHHSS